MNNAEPLCDLRFVKAGSSLAANRQRIRSRSRFNREPAVRTTFPWRRKTVSNLLRSSMFWPRSSAPGSSARELTAKKRLSAS